MKRGNEGNLTDLFGSLYTKPTCEEQISEKVSSSGRFDDLTHSSVLFYFPICVPISPTLLIFSLYHDVFNLEIIISEGRIKLLKIYLDQKPPQQIKVILVQKPQFHNFQDGGAHDDFDEIFFSRKFLIYNLVFTRSTQYSCMYRSNIFGYVSFRDVISQCMLLLNEDRVKIKIK